MGGYRFLEHISDILVEVWGETLEEAFCQAARALFDSMVEISRVERKITEKIKAEGFDLESLLYDWLEKLLVTHEIKNLVFSDFKVKIERIGENYVLEALAYGEEYDINKHTSKVAVKAVTYHEMSVEREDTRTRMRFLLDI